MTTPPLRLPQPVARVLLSLWFLFHLAMTVNYVWLDEQQKALLRPISAPYLNWLQLSQKWNMFKRAAEWDWFLEATATTPDGRTLDLGISREPPPGPFLRLRYDRTVKIHNIIVYEKPGEGRYGAHYARWLCTQAPEPVSAVSLAVRKVRHLTPEERRAGQRQQAEERTPLVEVACPAS